MAFHWRTNDGSTLLGSFVIFQGIIYFGGLPYDVFYKLYESIVCPVIMYGAPIWGTECQYNAMILPAQIQVFMELHTCLPFVIVFV